MSEFGAGVEQGNNMLSQMEGRNANIKASYNARVDAFNNQLKVTENTDKQQIQSGKSERSAQSNPEKLAGESTKLAQVGQRFKSSQAVLKQVYKGDKVAFVKGGGRVGDEIGSAGVGETLSSIKESAKSGYKAAKILVKTGGNTRVPGPQQVKPVNPGDPVGGSTTAKVDSSAVKSGTEAGAEAEEGSVAADRVALNTAKTVTGGVADALGSAGIAMGIVQGGVALETDLTGGFGKLANNEEKASNILSVASGVVDVVGLVFPPLEVLGGLLGIASAVTGTIGSLEEASAKVSTGQAALDKAGSTKPPAEQQGPGTVATLSSLGQIASVGSTVGAKISGSTSF